MQTNYCPPGTPVRRAGEENGPIGTVVVSHRPPMSFTGTGAHERWLATPSQVKVYWPGQPSTGLGADEWTPTGEDRVEWMLSSELDHAHPEYSYRPGDGEFYLFAVETGGYSDLRTVSGSGEQIAYVSDLDNPATSLPLSERDLGAEMRALMHRLVDATYDALDARESLGAIA